MNGWLLVDKPVGITSFQAINKFKKLLDVKTGHCGTLDPFASGFLLVALGKATKLVEYAMNFEKNYTFTVKWGISTDSDDLTGNVVGNCKIIPTKQQIVDKLECFLGEIDQVPPIFSAVKVKGKKAYEYARKGEELVLKSKKVYLKKFSLLSHENDLSTFNIVTNKGFYVRALARDFAKSLNTLAHVVELRRNQSGIFENMEMINAGITKDFLHNYEFCDYISSRILPLDYVLDDIPVYDLDLSDAKKLKNGQLVFHQLSLGNDSRVAIKSNNELVALCMYADGYLKPTKTF
jgi:tRNA pseudouridine55 synthase